jgi:hypothetical protein
MEECARRRQWRRGACSCSGSGCEQNVLLCLCWGVENVKKASKSCETPLDFLTTLDSSSRTSSERSFGTRV